MTHSMYKILEDVIQPDVKNVVLHVPNTKNEMEKKILLEMFHQEIPL